MSFLSSSLSLVKSRLITSTPSYIQQSIRFATKKTGGSTRNGRDSIGRRLGVKKFGAEYVIPGNIVVRQRGTVYRPGANMGMGKDHTLYALKPGFVKFIWNKHLERFEVHIVEDNPNPPPYVKKPKTSRRGAALEKIAAAAEVAAEAELNAGLATIKLA